MSTVIGVDSSTQSCKVLVVDVERGEVVASGSAPHPDGTAVDPRAWIDALRQAWEDAGAHERDDVVGVGVFAQQHGLVAVDADGEPVYDALLWNDVRSAGVAERMRSELGARAWVEAVGVQLSPSITLTKLVWLQENEPEAFARIDRVMLPHDWINLALTGQFVTDRSDTSGTGWYDAVSGGYRTDLIERFTGRVPKLPRVLEPDEPAGELVEGWLPRVAGPVVVSAGGGDNAGAALGLSAGEGDVVVSVGTSGTVFATSPNSLREAEGPIDHFADATGQFLPLLCTLNASRVMASVAGLLGVDIEEFNDLAIAGDDDAGGLSLLPYFDGERTPALPEATGSLHGITRASLTRENLARAAVAAVANSLADCLTVLRAGGLRTERILLIGGGARSRALQSLLPDTFGLPVLVPAAQEYVALGAARQAAWAATGEFVDLAPPVDTELTPSDDDGAHLMRAAYESHRVERYGDGAV